MEGVQHILLRTGNVMGLETQNGMASGHMDAKTCVDKALVHLLGNPLSHDIEVVAAGPAHAIVGPTAQQELHHITSPLSGSRVTTLTLFVGVGTSAADVLDALTTAVGQAELRTSPCPVTRLNLFVADGMSAEDTLGLWKSLEEIKINTTPCGAQIKELGLFESGDGSTLAAVCAAAAIPPACVLIGTHADSDNVAAVKAVADAHGIKMLAHACPPVSEMLGSLPLSALCPVLAARGVFSTAKTPSPAAGARQHFALGSPTDIIMHGGPDLSVLCEMPAAQSKVSDGWEASWMVMEQTINLCRSLIASRSFLVGLSADFTNCPLSPSS